MSWLPGVPVPKVRLGLPAKEVKSIHQKTPLAIYAVQVSKGCHCNTRSRISCKGEMADLLQSVYVNFPTASLLYIVSPPLSHLQFFHIPSCISFSHINNALWSIDCYMAATKAPVTRGNSFGLMNWQFKVDATNLTFLHLQTLLDLLI